MKALCRDCKEEIEVVAGRFVKHGQCAGWFAKVDDQAGWEASLESRFTDARPDCQHPERWHSSDADSTEWEVSLLVAAFVGALRPEVVVETGTAWGQTAKEIGAVVKEGNYGGVLHTIEPDLERVAHCRDLLGDLPVLVHDVTSLEWEPVPGIGFCWFDSLHDLRVPEFRRFYPYMTRGAFVGFHDTGPHQGTLHDEIMQLEDEGLLMPIFLPTPRGVCFGEVVKP